MLQQIEDEKLIFKKNIDVLLEMIESNVVKKEDREQNIGPFNFLDSYFYIRILSSSFNGYSLVNCESQLKTFLFLEILNIYTSNNNSNMTYKTIYNYLMGKNKKQYSFNFDTLKEYFNWYEEEEKNSIDSEEFAKSTRKYFKKWLSLFSPSKEYKEILKQLPTDKFLKKILWTARNKLKEYWEWLDCIIEEIKDKDNRVVIYYKDKKGKTYTETEYRKERQRKYEQCLLAVALQEVIYRNYCVEKGIVAAVGQCIEELANSADLSVETLKEIDKNKNQYLNEKKIELYGKMNESFLYVVANTYCAHFLKLLTEFSVALFAEELIIMLFASVELENDIGKNIGKWWPKKLFLGYSQKNKNRHNIHNELNEWSIETLKFYMQNKKSFEIYEQVEKFFDNIEDVNKKVEKIIDKTIYLGVNDLNMQFWEAESKLATTFLQINQEGVQTNKDNS